LKLAEKVVDGESTAAANIFQSYSNVMSSGGLIRRMGSRERGKRVVENEGERAVENEGRWQSRG